MVRVLELPGDVTERLRAEGVLPEGEDALVVTVGHGWIGEVGSLADRLTPRLDVPHPAVLEAARRLADARLDAAREHGLLSAEQVADLTGSKARNRSAAGYNLRRQGKVFALPTPEGERYPGFQFDVGTGKPLPAVAGVLAALAPLELSGEELLLWFTSPSGWLGDERPVDLLASGPERVVPAARRQAGEPGF